MKEREEAWFVGVMLNKKKRGRAARECTAGNEEVAPEGD